MACGILHEYFKSIAEEFPIIISRSHTYHCLIHSSSTSNEVISPIGGRGPPTRRDEEEMPETIAVAVF